MVCDRRVQDLSGPAAAGRDRLYFTDAIDAILNGEETNLSDAVFVQELTPGEGAENGIAASANGAVILTNQNCYLLQADEGVKVAWSTPYESIGAKESKEGDETTGGGLAWGSGCSRH